MVNEKRSAVSDFEQYLSLEKSVVFAPDDFTNPDELYDCLVERALKYYPPSGMLLVEKAYQFARKAHEGQKRKSGEPYIIHPLCVALILADLRVDKESISAGLLHDVVEDTVVEIETIKEEFGNEIAFLVDGVTKLGLIPKNYDKTEEQAENLKKMFVAMARDIRVLLIKLADRLHNVRTLTFRSAPKQIKVARETMDIYAPLAKRLGISKIKAELDDISLYYLRPDIYEQLVNKLKDTKESRDQFMNDTIEELKGVFLQEGIDVYVVGHVKHLFSIYRKMLNSGKTFEEFDQIFTFRIIVSSIEECYQVLRIIHDHYRPILENFKDYIAMPKPNRYQSIHTTLISGNGRFFDVQIRTGDMHFTSEYGIIAYWHYKEMGNKGSLAVHNEEKMNWLKQILEWQQDMSDNKEFMCILKSDFNLLEKQIYCFTPTGEVKTLPKGSNIIDFAYSIHAAIGNRMVGARVNNNHVSLDYQLESGDQIEIITSQNSKGPEQAWLNMVKTIRARNKINAWFNYDQKEADIVRGMRMLDTYMNNKQINKELIYIKCHQVKVAKRFYLKDWDGILASVGHGALKEGKVIGSLMEEYDKAYKFDEKGRGNTTGGIIIKNMHNPFIRLAKCCCPVPYDEIVGYVTKGRGVTIHRTDCKNIICLDEMERQQLVEVEWEEEMRCGKKKMYPCLIRIVAEKRMGVITDISELVYESKLDIKTLQSKSNEAGMVIVKLSMCVPGRDKMNDIIGKLNKIKGVVEIERF